jgi:hypothetical protein
LDLSTTQTSSAREYITDVKARFTTETDINITMMKSEAENYKVESKVFISQVIVALYVFISSTFLVVFIRRCHSLSRNIRAFLIHLSMCEIFVSLLAIFRAGVSFGGINNARLCAFIIQTGMFGDSLGQATMCLFALNQYLVVKNIHINNPRGLTFQNIIVVFVASWIIPALVSYTPTAFVHTPVSQHCYMLNGALDEGVVMVWPILFVLNMVVLTTIQILTLATMHLHKKRLERSGGPASIWVQSWYRRQMKIVFVIVLLWIEFLVCSGPLNLTGAIITVDWPGHQLLPQQH